MKTVDDLWRAFETDVGLLDAPPLQRKEMRRSFYAGFYACLMSTLQMADESGDDDEAGIAMMDKLHRECLAFAADVQAGVA